MGTRHLTMVIDEQGETKVAQYGQWDGYPEGQGNTVLKFLRNKKRISKLKNRLKDFHFATDEDQKEMDEFFKSIGSNDGGLNMEQAELYHKKYPLLTRDNGANVLNLILETKGKQFLVDSTDFAGDSLFCEWAYVIDFQNNMLEVYGGFNEEPLADDERFKYLEKLGQKDNYGRTIEYTSIKLIKKYSLDEIPTLKQLVEDCKIVEEEYE